MSYLALLYHIENNKKTTAFTMVFVLFVLTVYERARRSHQQEGFLFYLCILICMFTSETLAPAGGDLKQQLTSQ